MTTKNRSIKDFFLHLFYTFIVSSIIPCGFICNCTDAISAINRVLIMSIVMRMKEILHSWVESKLVTGGIYILQNVPFDLLLCDNSETHPVGQLWALSLRLLGEKMKELSHPTEKRTQ